MFPRGEMLIKVRKDYQEAKLPLLVIEGNKGPPLLGRNWLANIAITWQEIKVVRLGNQKKKLAALMDKYPMVWRGTLGAAVGVKAKLNLKEGAVPVFLKVRPLPYSLRTNLKVEVELARLQSLGVITPVSWSEWATPIVVVPKTDGTIQLCGDFRLTVNTALKIDKYPLPRVEDIFESLGKAVLYSKIDRPPASLQPARGGS